MFLRSVCVWGGGGRVSKAERTIQCGKALPIFRLEKVSLMILIPVFPLKVQRYSKKKRSLAFLWLLLQILEKNETSRAGREQTSDGLCSVRQPRTWGAATAHALTHVLQRAFGGVRREKGSRGAISPPGSL